MHEPAARQGPLLRLVYRLARSGIGRSIVGWLFAHMSFLLPVRRLRLTDTLIAFHHPRPAHAFHVVLVPRKALASLASLPAADTAFLLDLFRTVQELVAEFELPAYRLIANGGAYQDFPQLHFHLVSDDVRPRSPLPFSPD